MEFRYVWRDGVFGTLWEDGRFMPVIAGGAGDGDSGGDDDTEDEDEDDDNSGNRKDENDEDEDEDEDDIKDPKAALRSRDAANARLAKKIKRMEKEAAATAKKLKEQEDSKKSDADKVVEERDALKKQIEDKDVEITARDIRLALLEHDEVSKLSKRRRSLIAKLIADDIEVEDDGDTNIDDLLKDLKKEEPDLFASVSSETDDEDDDEPEKKNKVRAIGKKRKKGIDQAEMETRFPALRGRVSS